MPTPEFTYAGLENYTSVDFVYNRGVLPSVCLVKLPYQPDITTAVGPMTLAIDGDSITFTNCAVNRAHIRMDMRRKGPEWSVQIYDRRWRWLYGEVFGDYNRRLPIGAVFSTGKKNIRELATLLLTAMKETNFDVSILPTDVYPRALWKSINPARELERLCNLVGCVVTLGFDDRVTICLKGNGLTLPDNDEVRFTPNAITPTRKPCILRGVADDTRWQLKFELEAVGCEEDGSLAQLDNLTYKPAAGWSKQWWCSFADVADASKPLAFKYVWRWYRVKGLANGGWTFPNVDAPPESLAQLLPFDEGILDAPVGFDLEPTYQKEILEGEYWTQGDFAINCDPFTRYPGDFTFHRDIGVVELRYPAIYFDVSADPSNNFISPAKLFLTASCKLRNVNQKGYAAHRLDSILSPGIQPIEILRHPELKRTIIQRYDDRTPGDILDNRASVESELNSYLNNTANQYANIAPQDNSYIGMLFYPLDGALSQIHWQFGVGYGCKTRISRNMDHNVFSRDSFQRLRNDLIDVNTGLV